jgi:hypothetical protein
MSFEPSIGTLTDDERRLMETVDAVLDREMAVEPSPDFAAKVRARIAASEPDEGWNVRWGFAAAAVIVIATGILLAALRNGPADVDPLGVVTRHDVVLPASEPSSGSWITDPGSGLERASAGPRIPDPGSRVYRSVPASRIPYSGSRSDRAVEPEVLVPSGLREAVDRLMEMVRAGTLDERAFPPGRAAATVEGSAEPVPMVVEELRVPPIKLAGGGSEKGLGY